MFLAMIKLMRRLGAILKFSFENEVCDESGALGCWFQDQVPLFLTSPLSGEGADNYKLSRFLTQGRLVVK